MHAALRDRGWIIKHMNIKRLLAAAVRADHRAGGGAEARAAELKWAEVAARSAGGSSMNTEDQRLQGHFEGGGFVEVHTPRDSSVTTRQQSKIHHRKLVMVGNDYGVILGGQFVPLTSGRHSWIELLKLEI